MDLSKDDQPTAQTTDSQTVSVSSSAREDGTEAELPQPDDESTLNTRTDVKSTDSDDLRCSVHSLDSSPCSWCYSESSPEKELKVCLDSSKPESEALPLPAPLYRDLLTTQSPFTDIKPEPFHPLSLVKEVSSPESSGDSISVLSIKRTSFIGSLSTPSDSLDDDAIAGPPSDLHIHEGDRHDIILSQTADPSEIACPEYQPLLGTEVEKADCDPCILMCDSADTVTQCHSGFSEEQASENHVSEASQREELRPPAGNAWEVDWMLVSDMRSGKAEVTDLDIQPLSDSPVELWLDARQYLTDEDKEDLEVLKRVNPSVIQGAQVSDSVKTIGSPSDDIRGRGPAVERWSSVDSWASALSDWTGIIEDPSEDVAAAFAEIGAEIDALTQSLDELSPHTESEGLQEDLKTTVQEQAQEIMGVQDQPLKTPKIPESSIHSDQSGCSLCLDATGPELQDNIGSKCVESSCDPETTAKREQNPEELLHLSSAMALASPGGYTRDVAQLTLNVSPCDLNLYQSDGRSKTSEEDVFMNNEDHPIKLNITEDTDVNVRAELVIEEAYEHDLRRKTGACSLSLSGSVAEREVTCKENKPPADFNILWTHHPTDPDEPGVDPQPDRHTDVSQQQPSGESQVEQQSGSPDFIMRLVPLGSESPLCQTHSGLEGDQSLHNCLDCGHVRLSPPCSLLDEVTANPFLESDEELIHKKQSTINAYEKSSPDGRPEQRAEDSAHSFIDVPGDLLSHRLFLTDYFVISEKQRVAYVTLNLNDPFVPWTAKPIFTPREPEEDKLKMPHKTPKNPPEGKTHPKKEKSGCHHHGASRKQESPSHHVSTQETCKQQDGHLTTGGNQTSENREDGIKDGRTGIETSVGVTEKGSNKPHGKKKKKHGHTATIKSDGEPSVDVGGEAKPKTTKGRVDMFEAKLGAKAGKAQREINQSLSAEKKSKQPEDKVPQGEKPQTDQRDVPTKDQNRPPNDETVKRRRVSGDKFGKLVSNLESRLLKTDVSMKPKEEEAQGNVGAARKKAYSEVVKQKTPPKEDPEVVQPIQAASVSEDPQSLSLWCQFAAIHSDYSVTWSREGVVLAESKRSAGDERRVSLTITGASHKDLGKYECRLSSSHGSVTLDYLLTYEVLSEIVIPESPKAVSSPSVDVCNEEEDAHYSKLLFKQDFLSEQYFGENLPISIVTEKVHFGEGMHRRAFRTKLKAGQIPLLVPGHACVLKVHNAISYGTKNNDELVERNFNLAVEECQVQNTAREYIKDYTSAAQSVEAFGDVPEIIPIYLVHRPSNDVPYATLEEELIGDFVKYSIKDGKEINLMRRDSEAGQKCCAFQHWVYQKTDGNLLVTDMQGVGMKLTDVGIATCKKGYKGFKGNCATSFIDQFKALHQCNKYCEILGLKSLQPKAKKPPAALKPKPQPSAAPKKKAFGPTVKGKS